MTVSHRLLSLAGVLVFVSAAIHLSLGIAGLAEAAVGGGSAFLPALYLLGGLAALALLGAIVSDRFPATATYAAGTGLMVLFLLAYADWHAFGVAESTTGIDAGHGHDHAHDGDDHGHDHSHVHDDHDHAHSHDGAGHSHDHAHDHDGSTMELLIDHLREDAYALVSKSAEAAAATVLSILAITER
jgi:hypothetical protein